MSFIEREKFFLKLHLARIDDGVVRQRIYRRVVTIWWSRCRGWALTGLAAIASLLGLGAASHSVLGDVPVLPVGIPDAFYSSALGVQLALTVYCVAAYFKTQRETEKEPASFSLAEYLRVPDYKKAVGEIHEIHADLRRVMNVVPHSSEDGKPSPIVIFIDDLDRCSPAKVASVVEGVSMLLASDSYRCMFVIGMDPQLIAASLECAHEDVRKQLPRYERMVPLGWRFMDKFVQLPFTIPPSRGARLRDYIHWLGASAEPEPAAAPAGDTTRIDHAESKDEAPTPEPVVHDGTIPEARANSEGARLFVESRDVGKIVRIIGNWSVSNPREAKRMANLGRLYLALRDARRSRERSWRSPDVDAYARWILLTLRWPDLMRWLPWGRGRSGLDRDRSE